MACFIALMSSPYVEDWTILLPSVARVTPAHRLHDG
jgi:hypothetical protein